MSSVRSLSVLALLVLAISPTLASRPDNATSREIVVYRRNLAEIRETRTVELPSGNGYVDLQQIAPTIQPGSARIELISGKAETASLETLTRLLNMDGYWEGLLGQKVTLATKDTTYTGILRRVTSARLFLQEGDGPALILVPRGQVEDSLTIKHLPSGIVTETTLRWNVAKAKGGNAKIRLRYLADDVTWSGSHRLTLDGDKATLVSGTLVTNNTGFELPFTRLVLVGGEIHLAGDQRKVDRMNPAPGASSGDKPSRFGEVRRWIVDQPGVLSEDSRNLFTLSSEGNLSADRFYVYDAAIYNDRVHAKVEVTGEHAIPAGEVQVYESRDGDTWFTSSDNVDDTPPGSPLTLTLAQAFDLTAKRTRLSESAASGEDTRQSFRVTLGNSGPNAVTVRVLDRLFGDYSVPEATVNGKSVMHQAVDARTIRFDVPVESGGTSTLTYEIRYAR